jgi:peptidyl-prolyl cis-trans isomerase SurA
MKKTFAVGLGACAIALAFAAKDPVIMTVNGVDVPKSEFEYLYNKNSQQQVNPQTLDEYVEMFKLYKMKVADARAEGIDTMASFRREADQYRHELAAPYLADSLFLNSLVKEAYDRSKEEVEAYHIMLFKPRDPSMVDAARNRVDSIRQLLLNGADFADLATRFSQDRGSSAKGGRMGWMVANSYPYAFEVAAYNLPEGQISDVIDSGVGFHVLKGGKRRPARGKVKAAHILKLTQGKSDADKKKAKAEIDSLYQLVIANPATFNHIASTNSEDPGSARQGGVLPAFGTGEMVAEFDSVAFALADNEISEPFATSYGYHIIKKIGSEPIASMESIKPRLLARITSPQDPRFLMVRENQTKKLAKKHKGSLNEKNLQALRNDVKTLGLDSALYAKWNAAPQADMQVFAVNGKSTKLADVVENLSRIQLPASAYAVKEFDNVVDMLYNRELVNAEEDALLTEQPDYANLLREYVDGSLLYEVSVRKVWDKAAKDTEGLKAYFEANRDNYKWAEPRAKGFLVQALNDSVGNLVRERAAALPADSLISTIRKEFKGKAAIDRVLVSKGTNAMVDNIMFGGPESAPTNSKYTVYFMINPRLVNEPEEVADVKGMVTSDYQNEFQQAWENELRKKYPVTVNEKVLRKVKK